MFWNFPTWYWNNVTYFSMNILFFLYFLPLNDTVAYRSEWCQGKANQQGCLVPLHLWVSPYSKFGNCSSTSIKTDCNRGNLQAPHQARQSKNCSKKEFTGQVHQSACKNNQLWLKAVIMKEKNFLKDIFHELYWGYLLGQQRVRMGWCQVHTCWYETTLEKTSQIKVMFPRSQL